MIVKRYTVIKFICVFNDKVVEYVSSLKGKGLGEGRKKEWKNGSKKRVKKKKKLDVKSVKNLVEKVDKMGENWLQKL